MATLDVAPPIQTVVAPRVVAGLLVALAVATVAQDASGVIRAAAQGGTLTPPLARQVWAVDLSLEVPALLIGGVLLWSRHPLGRLSSPGLRVHTTHGFDPPGSTGPDARHVTG